MKKTNFMRMMPILGSVAFFGVAYAPIKSVRNVKDFDGELKKSALTIALFYNDDKQAHRDSILRSKLKNMRKNFARASNAEREVLFVSANVAKKELKELEQRYQLGAEPLMILFVNGMSVPFIIQKTGKRAELVGFPSERQIRDLIEDNLANDINEVVRLNEEKYRRGAEMRARHGPNLYMDWEDLAFGYTFHYPQHRWDYGYYWW